MLIRLTALQRTGASDPPTRQQRLVSPYIINQALPAELPGHGPCVQLQVEPDDMLYIEGTLDELLAKIEEAEE